MEITLLVILLSICGQFPIYTHQDIKNVIFNDVASQLNICSFGKCQLSGYVVPYTLSIPCQLPSTCNINAWASTTESFLSTTLNINLNSYMYHMYIIPNNVGCIGWSGLGTLSCNPMPCRSWIISDYSNIVAIYMHELGHNLGLQHAGTVNPLNDYGDLTDVMGQCCNTRCFNAIHSEQLGWTFPDLVFDANTVKGTIKIVELLRGKYFKLLLPTKWVYIQFWDIVYVYTTPPWTKGMFHPTTIEATIINSNQSIEIITPDVGTFKIILIRILTNASYLSLAFN